MQQPKLMISGGGTGGHIFPAIAIADEFKRRYPEAQILFVGARDRMEMEKVPQAGYPIEGIWISGLQRKLSAANLSFPFKLFSSLLRCRTLIRQFRPDVVVGTGGFASGPLLFSAHQKNLPTLIQEQNSFPGITNRLLAPRVNKICVAYEDMQRFFAAEKIVLTGNPIRSNIGKNTIAQAAALAKLGMNTRAKTILVLGGSLGARRINELIGDLAAGITGQGINLIWQCGKLYHQSLSGQWGQRSGDNFLLTPFLADMDSAYAAADLVISRAGAGTISELAAAAKATILIPSPNVAEDHQTKNALALQNREAALLFREQGDAADLEKLINEGLKPEVKARLEENIKYFARPEAAAHIVDELEKLLKSAG